MRFLFIIRAVPDVERFSAIAPHLTGHEVMLVDVSGGDALDAPLHLEILREEGCLPKPWWEMLGFDLSVPRPATTQDARLLMRVLAPDIVLLDQFGPTCAPAVVACRDAALELGICCCMIPHGVRVLDPVADQFPSGRSAKQADVVFFTSHAHFAQAAHFLAPVGVQYGILGDPRFDLGHLRRLQRAALKRGENLTSSSGLAYFGSRLPMPIIEHLQHGGTNAPEYEFLKDLRYHWPRLEIRRHPRAKPMCGSRSAAPESIAISTRATAVAALASSAVLEAIALGKPALVLDIEALLPGWRSIFTAYSQPLKSSGRLPFRQVQEQGEDLLRQYVWGGRGPHDTARIYAECIQSLGSRNCHPALQSR